MTSAVRKTLKNLDSGLRRNDVEGLLQEAPLQNLISAVTVCKRSPQSHRGHRGKKMAVLKKSTANRDLALDLARSPTCFSLRSLWSVVDFCASKPILSQSKDLCGERVRHFMSVFEQNLQLPSYFANQANPVATGFLTENPHRGIPGGIGTLQEPAPLTRMSQHDPYCLA